MTPEDALVAAKDEVEEQSPAHSPDEAAESDEDEDFNPLGNIEGWSAFECASGPFGFRG